MAKRYPKAGESAIPVFRLFQDGSMHLIIGAARRLGVQIEHNKRRTGNRADVQATSARGAVVRTVLVTTLYSAGFFRKAF